MFEGVGVRGTEGVVDDAVADVGLKHPAQHPTGPTTPTPLPDKAPLLIPFPIIQEPPVTPKLEHLPIQLIQIPKIIELVPNRRQLVEHAILVGRQVLHGHLADQHGEHEADYRRENLADVGAFLTVL